MIFGNTPVEYYSVSIPYLAVKPSPVTTEVKTPCPLIVCGPRVGVQHAGTQVKVWFTSIKCESCSIGADRPKTTDDALWGKLRYLHYLVYTCGERKKAFPPWSGK